MSWLGPDTCGVKLQEFDRMTQDMSRAARSLEDLAHHVWQALHGAGVSTGPAMEIKRLASWAATASADLRRRSLLAHNLDRQKLAMTVCRPDGTYLKLPDRYNDQIAYADGRRTADLVRRAAAGDQKAMAELRRIIARDVKPAFAKGLLEALGPEGLLKVPLDFNLELKADLHRHRNADATAWDARAVISLLGRSLAISSHPNRSGSIGDDYLKQLTQAGRATFPPHGKPPHAVVGYQSLSTNLAAAGGNRFSPEFLRTVGSDMIAYDRDIHRQQWGRPLPDLTGKFALGNALDPGTTHVKLGERKTDYLMPLLDIAITSGRQGAQALLSPRPMGPYTGDPSTTFPKNTNLEYLIRERRMIWAETDHGATLSHLIETAAKGHDPESERLALHTIDLLAREARGYFSVDPGALELRTGDKKTMDALSGLRPHVANLLSTHIVKVNDLYRTFILGANRTNAPVTDADLDYVILDLSRNSDAFSTLLKAQIAHTKADIDRAAGGDRTRLTNAIVVNGQIFGHLLEARNQTTLAEDDRVEAANEQLRNMVSSGVGLISDVGSEAVAKRGGTAGAMAYENTVHKALEALALQAAKRYEEQPDKTLTKPTTNTEAIESLFGQLLISSFLVSGKVDSRNLEGKSFATDDRPPRLRPLDSLTPRQYDELSRWVDERFRISELQERAARASDSGMNQTVGHYRTPDGRFNVKRSGQR